MHSKTLARYVRFGLLLAAASMPALAAADVTTLDEVVVTAQKREQNLQDVGVSVTALGSEELGRLGLASSTDLTQQVPSLQFQSTTTFSTFNIRGVSQTEFTDQHELPVAVVVDGVYLSSPGVVQTQLFDLDRVEVLRGPQGTLFGRNSTGGLVHFISKQPGDELDGHVEVGVGSYDQVRLDAAVGGPISDTVAGRLAVAVDRHDGYLENALGADVLASRVYSARGQLLFRPHDGLRVLLKAQTSRNDDEKSGGYAWAPAAPGADGLGERIGPNDNPWGTCDGCDLVGYRNPTPNDWREAFDTVGFFDRRANEGSVTIDYETPVGTLTSVSDYYTHRKNYLEDTDATPVPLFAYTTAHKLDQFSQELRLARNANGWVTTAGLYYLNIDSRFDQTLAFNFGPGIDLVGGDERKDKTESWAVFAHVEAPLAPAWRLVAGARWTHDERRLDAVTVDPFGPGVPVVINPGTVGSGAKITFGNWQGKLQLEWRPGEDTLLYAGASRGTKAGGFQGRLDPNLLSFDEEVLLAYEVGFKHTAWDGRARLNGSVFYYDYRDYQAFQFNQRTLATTIRNLPAKVKGAELELLARPTEPLEVSLGVSLLDAEAEGVSLPGGRIADRDLPQAPKSSVNGRARYTFELGAGQLWLQADAKYNASSYFTVNNAPVEREPGYALTNLRVGFDSAGGRYGVAAYVRNVANRYYRVYSLDVSGLGFSNDRPGVPRWFGLDFTYHFAR